MAGNSASSAVLAHAPGCTGAALYFGQRKHGHCASCLSLLALVTARSPLDLFWASGSVEGPWLPARYSLS